MAKKKQTGPTPIDAIKHKDARVNIPTCSRWRASHPSILYSTFSRPFAPPDSGRIAVKVINHDGDEVLNVYDVQPGA